MAIVDLFSLLKSNYNSTHFCAEPEDAVAIKEKSWKLILITIFPFILDIVDLFLSTINLFIPKFTSSNFKINLINELEFYNALSAYWNLWWFVVVGWYVRKNKDAFIQKNEKFWSSNIVLFMIYIFIDKCLSSSVRAILHFINDFSSIRINSGSIEWLTSAYSTLSLVLTVGIILNYFFNKSVIWNSYCKMFYDSGFYNDKGKWIILQHDKKNVKKIKSSILYLSTCFAISIILTAIIRQIGGLLEKIIFGSGTTISEGQGKNQSGIASGLKNSSTLDLLQLVLQIVIIAPIWEELLYRHIILNINNFSKSSVFLASFIFSLVHLSPGENIFTFIAYFGSSLVFTAVYKQNKNILFPMILHGWNNVLVLIFFWITEITKK